VGEIRGFEFRQGGKVIGRSFGRYVGPIEGAPGQHLFETRIELLVPDREPLRSVGEIVLDERGHLVRGHERSNAAEIVFERDRELLRLRSGTIEDEVGYDPERSDVAFMAHSAILHAELMFGLRKLSRGEMSWRLVSLSGGVPVEYSAVLSVPDAAKPDTAVVHTSLGEVVTLQGGRIREIRVDADQLDVSELDPTPPWPTWTVEGPRKLVYEPAPDAAFTRHEVELPGRPSEPRLAGEVLVPRGGKPPFPGVLFLSGTGRQDRYGFAGPPPVDLGSHEITDALANAGFVVLRYDERGFGGSEAGDELSFMAQIEDARRGLRTLLVQDAVDPNRIVIVAHGEGGWRALRIAGRSPEGIRGVALLASPGRRYDEVFAAQAEAAAARIPPALREQARREQARILDDLKSGRPVPELLDQARWIREAFRQDPEKLVADVRCPLWVAQGGKDFEVDPEADVRALQRAAKRGRRKIKVKRYKDLDHLFMHEPEASAPVRYLEPGRHVDQGFLEDLVTWTRRVSRP
jgi:pimeloyl-ACP methyl ester carboxylesterase